MGFPWRHASTRTNATEIWIWICGVVGSYNATCCYLTHHQCTCIIPHAARCLLLVGSRRGGTGHWALGCSCCLSSCCLVFWPRRTASLLDSYLSRAYLPGLHYLNLGTISSPPIPFPPFLSPLLPIVHLLAQSGKASIKFQVASQLERHISSSSPPPVHHSSTTTSRNPETVPPLPTKPTHRASAMQNIRSKIKRKLSMRDKDGTYQHNQPSSSMGGLPDTLCMLTNPPSQRRRLRRSLGCRRRDDGTPASRDRKG